MKDSTKPKASLIDLVRYCLEGKKDCTSGYAVAEVLLSLEDRRNIDKFVLLFLQEEVRDKAKEVYEYCSANDVLPSSLIDDGNSTLSKIAKKYAIK